MKRIWFKLLLLMVTLFTSMHTFAQSREYIRNSIKQWGECRNVAITKYNGDLALYGKNGYSISGCPESLNDAIKELRQEGEYIDDVQLTERGSWLILYGNNGIIWSTIPYSLEQKLREFNQNGETITSVTFNDAGNWIVITNDYISSSHNEISNWLAEGNKLYGRLWAACVTDDALIAVYEDGYQYLGNIPYTLEKALRETSIDVFRLKIAGTAWFFADTEGRFRYDM